MKRLALIAALMLTACEGSDGYRYERTEFDRRQIAVTVVVHSSTADLRAEAKRLDVGAGEGKELMAFGIVKANRPACTIHIVEPANGYFPEWIGHELTHCIRGRWHSLYPNGGNRKAPAQVASGNAPLRPKSSDQWKGRMTQASDIGDVKITLAEQVVVLRETKHLVANMATKLDALAEKVIVLSSLATEVADLKNRVTQLEAWKLRQEGALGLGDWLIKLLPAAVFAAVLAGAAKLLGIVV